ncbi:MAG: hypothetical protein VXZ82_06025 [Planctomycetota bacterium]|nr:hypothetical protein [Planctomycetota bacterium]
MFHRFFLFLPLTLTLIQTAPAFAYADLVLVGYDTTNPNGANGSPSPDLPAAENQNFISPLLLSRGAGVTPNQGIAFNSSNWSLSNSVDLQSDKYIEWGWSASTQAVDLTSMTLQYDVSGSGPSQLAIALSTNGGAFSTIFSDSFVDPSDETHTIDLSSFTLVSNATFRLFGFDANSSGGTLDIEEITPGGRRGVLIHGNVAVPEPSSTALVCCCLTITLCRRRKH